MPKTVTCTSCRARIDIPEEHAEPTIRCGICWTEVTLFTKPAPLPVAQALPAKSVARPVAQLLPPPPPKAGPRPSVVATPTKPAPGMAKLEGLIQKAAAKLAPPSTAVPHQPAPVVAALKPLTAEAVPLPSVQPKPPQMATPIPIPQAPVPMPVRVPSNHPPIEVQPIPSAAAPLVVVPVALNSVPVVAPIAVPVEPVPVPARSNSTADGAPIVQGEVAEEKPRPVAKSSRNSEKTRSQYKRRDDRDDDDDDDDDDRRSSRQGKAKNGPMVGLIVGGLAVFVLLCVGGYYLAQAFRGNKSDPVPQAANINAPDPAPAPQIQFNLPNADANPPGFNQPNLPFPQFPNMPPNFPQPNFPGFNAKFEWTEHAGDGFKVKVVSRPTETPTIVRLHDEAFLISHATGKHLRAASTPPAATTEVTYVDAPQGVTPDLKKVTADPFGPADKVTACKVANKDGFELVESRGAQVITTRCVQVGCRVFVFKFTAWDAFGDKDTNEAAKKTFFDSVSITFDPATPAPVDPNLRPKRVNPRLKGNAVPPPPPPGFPNADAGDRPFAAQNLLKLAVRIDPFIAAVTFPDRGEAFTVGFRANTNRLGGELRRYEYPGFKLKNTYFLPHAATFAGGSDKTNRLALTTITKADGYTDGERSIVIGDVQIFDLKPIFEDKVAQREELKPLATLAQPANTRLAGLEVSPDGSTAYFLSLGRGAKTAKSMVFRLGRADLVAGKLIGHMELPEAAWRLRMSADGAKLYAAEVPLNAAGNVNVVPNRATNVVTVDVGQWQIERTDQLAAGTALDFLPLSSDTLVASVLGNGNNHSLWSVRAGAPATALDTPGQQPVSLGYVARTADGKRLITSSAGRFSGDLVEVYDVSDWKSAAGFKKIASARLAKLNDQPGEPGVKVGHNFELTPDGKYAAFCDTGAVVDLGAIGKQ